MRLPVTEPNYLGPWTSTPVAFHHELLEVCKEGD